MLDSVCVRIPSDGMQVFEPEQENRLVLGPGRGRLRRRLTRTLQLPVETLQALQRGAGRLA